MSADDNVKEKTRDKNKTSSKARKKTGNEASGAKGKGRKNMLSSASSRTKVEKTGGAPKGAVASKPAGKMLTFLREVKIEMSKVTWPPRKELLQATGVVIVAVVIAGAYIGVFDFIWNIIVRSVGLG